MQHNMYCSKNYVAPLWEPLW